MATRTAVDYKRYPNAGSAPKSPRIPISASDGALRGRSSCFAPRWSGSRFCSCRHSQITTLVQDRGAGRKFSRVRPICAATASRAKPGADHTIQFRACLRPARNLDHWLREIFRRRPRSRLTHYDRMFRIIRAHYQVGDDIVPNHTWDAPPRGRSAPGTGVSWRSRNRSPSA